MTSLRQAVQDYLSLRRSLGFKLRCAGALLLKFAAFAETRGTEYVTISLALEWATLPPHQKPATWADRLKAVRVFARYQQAIDARTEVQPFGLLPYRPPRARPYLYTAEESKYPPAKPGALRLLVPQRGLIATDQRQKPKPRETAARTVPSQSQGW
jgi:hypothetical protein